MKIISNMILVLLLLGVGTLHAESDEAVKLNREGADLVNQGKMEEASGAFQKAVELDANDPVPRLNLAYTYDRQGRTEEAIAEYRKAIELDPSNLLAYNNLGVLYDKMGQYDAAIGEFQRALEIDPTDANALKNLENAKKNKTVIQEREGELAELREVKPVIFPPGRTRLTTKPCLTGSSPLPITMGIVRVTFLAARVEAAVADKMQSTLSLTSSAASPGRRFLSPFANRHSMTMFWPSMYPSSRRPCRNAFG